jgi:hypothetical protein
MSKPTADSISWHQAKAARRRHQLRKKPAHIHADNYIATGKTLCGLKDPLVWILADRRNSPGNLCCKTCKRIADARSDENHKNKGK